MAVPVTLNFSSVLTRGLLSTLSLVLVPSTTAGWAHQVVFDTNRAWCARLPLLRTLFSEAKVICCVRNVAWVLMTLFLALPHAVIAVITGLALIPALMGSVENALRQALTSSREPDLSHMVDAATSLAAGLVGSVIEPTYGDSG